MGIIGLVVEKDKGATTIMDKQTIIQNILINYGKYGITREMIKENIEPLIDDGIKDGLTYDLIYLYLRSMMDKLTGQEFYCTSEEMARAFGVSRDEMQRIIEESREELIEAGENPDDYFREVQATRFIM